MSFHKDLTGTDLHESKVTLLNGSPISLSTVASGAGIVAIDTSVTPNKMYRANSTAPGDWQEVGASGGSSPFTGTGAFVQTNMFQVHSDSGGTISANTGLTTNGTNRLYILNSQDNKIQVFDLNGNKLADYSLLAPQGGYTDIMYAGNYLWVIDNSILYKIDPANGNLLGSFSPNAEGSFQRLANDGTSIFISASPGRGIVYKFDPSSNTYSKNYDIAESVVVDSVASDGGNTLWEVTRSSANIRKVYRDSQFATLGMFGLQFQAVTDGVGGNSITIQFTMGAPTSTPVISVVGQAISIQVNNGVTTEREVVRAVNSDVAASALVYVDSTSPGPARNYNQAPYNTAQNMSGGLDHLISTIDVSASGLPVNVLYLGGFAWVTMNNGDLLKIDVSTDAITTFSSGTSALAGIAYDSYFIYVTSTAPSNKILVFDITLNYFVDVISPGMTPDDLVWDGNNNLWVISRTSANIKRIDRVTGLLLGTTDVSASGLPRRGAFIGSTLYVTMNNGDLLEIDPTTDTVIGTNVSGAASLDGITAWNGSLFYVSDAAGKQIIPFTPTGPTFGTPLDLSAINTPNDICYDTGGTLWSLDFTSAVIKRIDTSGNFQSDVNTAIASDPGALPRRLGPTLFSGSLWVTASSGKLLRCDPYGPYGVYQAMAVGDPNLTGITNVNGVDFYLSATGGTNGIVRFVWDGSGWFGRMVSSQALGNIALQLKVSGNRFVTIDGTTTIIRRWETDPSGTAAGTADIFPNGTPKDIVSHINENVLYAVTSTGNVMEVFNGNEQVASSIVAQDLTYTATSGGRGGNSYSVQYVTGGAPGTVAQVNWDGQHLILQIDSGTTTANTISSFVNSGGYSFTATVSGTGSNPQVTMVQTFLEGGTDTGFALGRATPSGRNALSAITDNGSGGSTGLNGFIMTYTSPSNGYRLLANYGTPFSGPYSIGGRWAAGNPAGMAINGDDLWVSDSSFSYAPRRFSVASMTPVDFVMGTDNSSYHVVLIGGFAYYDSNGYPNLYKVDPATNNAIKTLVLGSQTGGNFYSWGVGLFTDGTSIWFLGMDSPSSDSHMSIERLDSTGRSFAAICDFDRGYNGWDYRMVRVGDFLFARVSNHLVKFNVNLG